MSEPFIRYVITIHDGRRRELYIVDALNTEAAKVEEQSLQATTKKPPHYAAPMPQPYRNYCRYCGRVYKVQNGDEIRAYRLLEKHEAQHERHGKYFKSLSVLRPIIGQYAWEVRWGRWSGTQANNTTGIEPGGHVLYLGAIPNTHGHCAVITGQGRVVWMLHPDEFELVPEEDL